MHCFYKTGVSNTRLAGHIRLMKAVRLATLLGITIAIRPNTARKNELPNSTCWQLLFGKLALLTWLRESCQVCPFWDLVVLFKLNKRGQTENILSWEQAVLCVRPAAGDRLFPSSSPRYHFDLQWLAHLTLITDITAHLKALHMMLQGKNILVTDMVAHINAFEVNMCLVVWCQVCVLSLLCWLCP